MIFQRILDSSDNVTPGHVLPDAEIGDVLNSFAFQNVRALVVSSYGKKVEGLIAGREIVRGLLRLPEMQSEAEALSNCSAGGV